MQASTSPRPSIVLLADQSPLPAENYFGCDGACNLSQCPPSESLASLSKSTALGVSQPKRLLAEMPTHGDRPKLLLNRFEKSAELSYFTLRTFLGSLVSRGVGGERALKNVTPNWHLSAAVAANLLDSGDDLAD